MHVPLFCNVCDCVMVSMITLSSYVLREFFFTSSVLVSRLKEAIEIISNIIMFLPGGRFPISSVKVPSPRFLKTPKSEEKKTHFRYCTCIPALGASNYRQPVSPSLVRAGICISYKVSCGFTMSKTFSSKITAHTVSHL